MDETTVFYWQEDGSIGVTTMNQSQIKKSREVKFTARELVNYRLNSIYYALSNEVFAVKERIAKIIETEQKLENFYEQMGETELRDKVVNVETIAKIDRFIKDLQSLREKLK